MRFKNATLPECNVCDTNAVKAACVRRGCAALEDVDVDCYSTILVRLKAPICVRIDNPSRAPLPHRWASATPVRFSCFAGDGVVTEARAVLLIAPM
jgi:hypothetical protein